MPPFRVQCETCQATFRVRDERVVGQVHACPKCGGMVLLAPPEGLPAEAGATEDTADVSAETAAAGEAAPVIEAAPGLSPAEARGRSAAIGVAVGGLAFVAAATAIALAFRSGEPAEPDPVANPQLLAQTEPTPPEPTPAESIDSEPERELAPPESPAAEPVEPTEQPAVEPPAVDLPVDALPVVELPDEKQPQPQALPPNKSPAAQPAPATETIAASPGTLDPLDFDPASADLILTRGPRKPTPEPIDPQPATPANAQLDARIASAAPVDERGATIDQGLAARAAGLKVWGRLGDTGQAPPPTPAAEALGAVVPEIELRDWPLGRTINLLSRIGGAPITLPPAALRHAGVTADRPVTVAGRGRTLGELLDTSLRPLSLECVNRGGKLVVARRDADEPHTAGYSVDDLAGEDRDALVDLVRTALDLNGADIELGFADQKLTLAATRADHYELLVFCERLRKARGLPLRSKYPSELLGDRPALAALAPRLDRQATFSFVQDTPLGRVVEHWRSALGAPVLVDWAALADRGLAPTTPVTAAARDATWREALDGVLTDQGLTWRAVDAGVIEITTSDGAEASPSIDFYPAADRTEADRLAPSLTNADATRHDPASRALIVRSPGTTAR